MLQLSLEQSLLTFIHTILPLMHQFYFCFQVNFFQISIKQKLEFTQKFLKFLNICAFNMFAFIHYNLNA